MADNDGLDALDRSAEGGSRAVAEFAQELVRLRDSMTYTSREVSTLSSGIEGGLRRAFNGLVFDGVKLGDALKNVARSMVDTAFSVAMKPVQQAMAGGMAQMVNGMVSSAMPFADGGAFAQGRVMPFARGGVISQPTYFPMRGLTGLMGEAGPEAIMPLRRGADGRLGVAAGGAGAGRAMNVTVNIATPDVEGFRRSQTQIAAQLGRALSRGNRNS